MAEDCIFCSIVAGDQDATLLAEDDATLAFLDIAPWTRGHALVIPRRHSRNLYEIGADDLAATLATAKVLAQRMRDRLGADGVNLLNSCEPAAWQTVFHFHMHVIPRYDGDPLVLPARPGSSDPAEAAEIARQLGG